MKIFKSAVLRTLSVAIILGSSVSLSLASSGLSVSPVSNDSKVKVSFGELNSKTVVLSIEDYSEKVVFYSEKITNPSGFSKVFDLSALKDGEYLILVKTDSDVITTEVSIRDSKVIAKVEKEEVKPLFKLSEDILLVFFSNNEGENYSISFADGSGDFFTDSTSDISVVKKYNLSKLPVGEYTVMVSSEDNSFAYSITK